VAHRVIERSAALCVAAIQHGPATGGQMIDEAIEDPGVQDRSAFIVALL
jgi:hypothetical protein